MKRSTLVALAIAALAAAGTARAGTPLYGVVRPGALARLDRQTLRPVGPWAPAAGHVFGWSFSPDGGEAAAGDQAGELRLYDLRRMRVVGDVRLARDGLVYASVWAGPRLVLATVVRPGCCGIGTTRVVAVDSASRRVLWRRDFHASLQAGARFRRSLALVLGPSHGVGPSRLAVVAPDGRVRAVRLAAIRSGLARDGGADPQHAVFDSWNPGLAIDESGRAFVVQAGEPVAEVDLRTLRVRLHPLAGRGLATATKAERGPSRDAIWLGGGLLAVTGGESRVFTDASGAEQERDLAAGLWLVDTRTWTERELDDRTSRMALAGRTLLGFGTQWDSAAQRLAGDGVRGYTLGGSPRFHLYAGEPVGDLTVAGSVVLVSGDGGSSLFGRTVVVDPRSGRELRRVRRTPWVVAGADAFWY